MFCILNINKRDNTLFERLFGRWIGDTYSLETVPVFKGAPYYILNVTVGKRGVDWDRIVGTAGKCAKRLLITNSVEFPERSDVGMFKSRVLYGKMMKNTFLRILDNNISHKNLKSICLIDKKGAYADFALSLAEYALKLTVITDEKEIYKNTCTEIMERYGLCPSVQSSPCYAEIKIDADRDIMTVKTEKRFINISNGEDFSVPDIYAELLPEELNKYDFYSALYELCGVFRISETSFDTVDANGEKKRADTVQFA
ncbi:MAG: hypothetical protein J1F23_04675 [Oscillospiraceae bacterium]|nr:hypothetical protein [Oscillospiraceae bacterium]